MSKLKLVKTFNIIEKYVNEYYQEELDRIELVMKSIPDPEKLYAVYDMNTGEVQYIEKEKPINKKVVLIKPRR